MGKAKIASKNNPAGRSQAVEYFHDGKKIKPVKYFPGARSFLAAEYDGSGDLVKDTNGNILPWAKAKLLG